MADESKGELVFEETKARDVVPGDVVKHGGKQRPVVATVRVGQGDSDVSYLTFEGRRTPETFDANELVEAARVGERP